MYIKRKLRTNFQIDEEQMQLKMHSISIQVTTSYSVFKYIASLHRLVISYFNNITRSNMYIKDVLLFDCICVGVIYLNVLTASKDWRASGDGTYITKRVMLKKGVTGDKKKSNIFKYRANILMSYNLLQVVRSSCAVIYA